MAKANGNGNGSIPAWMVGQEGHTFKREPKYRLIQWYNNQQAANVKAFPNDVRGTGGFAAKVEHVGEEFPVGVRMDYTYSKGEEAEIYSIGAAEIAILAFRTRFYLDQYNPATGKDETVWLPAGEYRKGAKGKNWFLIFLRGAEQWHLEHGPLLLVAKGTTGIALKRDVMDTFMDGPHAAIERASGGMVISPYTFFIPVVPGPMTRVGNAQNSSNVTPPALWLDSFDKSNPGEYAAAQFVGPELLNLGNSLWEEAQEWAKRGVGGSADSEFESGGEYEPESNNGNVDLTTGSF